MSLRPTLGFATLLGLAVAVACGSDDDTGLTGSGGATTGGTGRWRPVPLGHAAIEGLLPGIGTHGRHALQRPGRPRVLLPERRLPLQQPARARRLGDHRV